MPTPRTEPIQILLITDQTLIRTALRMLLDSQPGLRVVSEAGNCADALMLATHRPPDIILFDLDHGGAHAIDCIPQLLAVGPKVRLIVLTGRGDVALHQQAVRLGAVGLVPKATEAETLCKAIERVHAGEAWLERTMMADVLSHAMPTSRPVAPEAVKIATLTEREREVIALLGKGLRNKQIADRLFISEPTVRHHLTSIFGKLAVADRLELVIYAFRHHLIAV
jgi:DNA-binding NarL/FixJ family response regulator